MTSSANIPTGLPLHEERLSGTHSSARVYGVAIESPLEGAPALSARIGNRLLLKREDLRDAVRFRRFLLRLGYPHWEETHNPAWREAC